jgi:hypothetical protein
MRNLAFVVVIVAAVIFMVLFLQRMKHVPTDVRATLGDSIKTMQEVPDAVRAKVGQDLQTGQGRIDSAMKESNQ